MHDGASDAWGGAASSAAMLGLLAFAAILHAWGPSLYRASVQEDAWLEWASFHAFAAAAALHARAAWRRRGSQPLAGVTLGSVALFCAFVALEEISWGQRLVAARPPIYFLERNAQQEINLHNLVDTSLRMFALQAVLIGYGVVLPLLGGPAATRRALRRVGVLPPPPGVVPGFAAASAVYAAYPWSHTGEWVEAVMGLGFLHAGLAVGERPLRAARVAAGTLLLLAAGAATAAATQLGLPGDAERIAAARREADALARDFGGGRVPLRCNLHKRVYTYVRDYRATPLEEGAFQALVAHGLPAERARFFLDPWNSPWWVRYACEGDAPVLMVYSFGPDRRRDASRSALRGDDVGVRIDPTRRPR